MRTPSSVSFLLVALVACRTTPQDKPAAEPASAPEATEDEAAPAPLVVESGSIEAALAGAHRTEEERARDAYRHPEETLAFFGVEPDMTVIELWPGGGWYTAVLAPYLKGQGRLIAGTLDPADQTFRGRFARAFREKMAATPEVYGDVEMKVFFLPTSVDLGENVADAVLSFRSVHNWIRWEGHEPQPYFDAIARALKPGGVFGVVQHRAPPELEGGDTGKLGYLYEAKVIEHAEKAGLELVEKSDLNANPNDPHDHPEGVWTLPPTLRLGDKDRAKYEAIGESDRMTLKFVKPPAP